MACRYYDDLMVKKLQRWLPEASGLRVLKPNETKKLFELTASDNNDRGFQLPLITLSRDTSITLLSTVKNPKSFDGLKIDHKEAMLGGKAIKTHTAQLNVLPIKLVYQLDIYTKTYEEGDEYLRNFLFKLINNPTIKISIPYNGLNIEHIANIRVLDTVSDTSDISERIFSGQFTRWTIQMEIHDAFLFSIPYKQNWRFATEEDGNYVDLTGSLEIVTPIKKNNTTENYTEVENLDNIRLNGSQNEKYL